MLGDRLPRHVEVFAQLAKRLPAALVQLVEQLPAAFVCQSLEHCIHLAHYYATTWLHVKGCFHPLLSLCAVRKSQRDSVPKPRVARHPPAQATAGRASYPGKNRSKNQPQRGWGRR